MASTINATSTGSGGLITTGNSVNQLELQTGDTTRVVIDSSGNVTIQGQGDLRLADSDSSHYVALQAPGTVASNVTFTLPSADGTSGQVLQTNGSGVLSFATPAGANFQEFTSSGTWTKPSGATFVMVEAWGAGGGGSSGRRQPSGAAANPGPGGGGGAYVYRLFKASDLAGTVTVTIGTGGTGGAAVTANCSNGNAGAAGGDTTFGTHLTAYGGGAPAAPAGTGAGGAGGGVLGAATSVTVAGEPVGINDADLGKVYSNGFGGGVWFPTTLQEAFASGFGGGAGGGFISGSISKPGGSSYQGGGGGGAGGGINTCNNLVSASDGGSKTGRNGGGGAAGTAGGAGTAGTNGFGGGGGASALLAAGGAGGAGGQPGGGGGGGAGSRNGYNSGAGGVGGAGLVRVYTW